MYVDANLGNCIIIITSIFSGLFINVQELNRNYVLLYVLIMTIKKISPRSVLAANYRYLCYIHNLSHVDWQLKFEFMSSKMSFFVFKW